MPLRFIGRTASIIGLGVAIATVTGVTAALIAEKAISPELRQQALCTAGYVEFAETECVSTRLAALNDQAQQAEVELKAAQEARELAEHALVGRMVFEEGISGQIQHDRLWIALVFQLPPECRLVHFPTLGSRFCSSRTLPYRAAPGNEKALGAGGKHH